MRFFPLAASLVTAGMMWNVSAQDTLNPDANLAGTGLRRVVQESDVGTQEPGAPVDVALWRSALTDADLDAREAAFGRFVRAAQRDVALHPLLAEWRQAGGELGWTARMIQRELDRTGLGPATPWSRPDITSTIEDMRRQAERLRAGLGAPQGGTASRQSTSVQVEQDSGGVTVTISEDVNGAIQTETYAGPDLDAVRSAMPEEHRKLISGSSMGLRVGTHPFIASDLFDQHLEPFGGLRPVHGIDDLMRDFLDPGGLHRLPFDQPFAPFGEPLGLRGPALVDPTYPPVRGGPEHARPTIGSRRRGTDRHGARRRHPRDRGHRAGPAGLGWSRRTRGDHRGPDGSPTRPPVPRRLTAGGFETGPMRGERIGPVAFRARSPFAVSRRSAG